MLFKIGNGETLIMKGALKDHDIDTWQLEDHEYQPSGKTLIIKTPDNRIVGDKLHRQLVGNQNYIDSNIVLNIGTEGQVLLFIDESSTDDIEIDGDLNLKIFRKR